MKSVNTRLVITVRNCLHVKIMNKQTEKPAEICRASMHSFFNFMNFATASESGKLIDLLSLSSQSNCIYSGIQTLDLTLC